MAAEEVICCSENLLFHVYLDLCQRTRSQNFRKSKKFTLGQLASLIQHNGGRKTSKMCNWLICHVIAQDPRPGQLCAHAQDSDKNNWPFSTHGQTSKWMEAALKPRQLYMRPSIKECSSLISSLQNQTFFSFSQRGIRLMENKNK